MKKVGNTYFSFVRRQRQHTHKDRFHRHDKLYFGLREPAEHCHAAGDWRHGHVPLRSIRQKNLQILFERDIRVRLRRRQPNRGDELSRSSCCGYSDGLNIDGRRQSLCPKEHSVQGRLRDVQPLLVPPEARPVRRCPEGNASNEPLAHTTPEQISGLRCLLYFDGGWVAFWS